MSRAAVPVAHRLVRALERERRGGTPSFPVHAQIEICSTCDGRCAYCPPSERRGQHLDANVLAGWLSAWSQQGLESVSFHGFGEPLAAPGIEDILSTARDAGLSVELTTNGDALTKFADVVAASVSLVAVSIDTVDPILARKLRPGIDLASALAGVEAIRNAGVSRVELWATVTRPMLDTLTELVEWAASAGVDGVVLQPLGGPAARGPLSVSLSESSQLIDLAATRAAELGLRLNSHRITSTTPMRCLAPTCTMCLRIHDSTSANMFPCCNWNPSTPLGLIREPEDLAILWASESRGSVLDALSRGDWPRGCDGCPAVSVPR